MDLTTFIYDFNLATTTTDKDKYEICSIINNGRKRKIDYQNCISLYNVVEIFNNAYIKYMEDKDEFNNLLSNLGEDILYGYHHISDDYTFLCLEVLKPKPDVFFLEYTIIYLINNENFYYGYANNGLKITDSEYKTKEINLDEGDIKSCIDIVKKHHLFLECFENLRNKQVLGDGTTVVFTKIDDDICNQLKTFTLTFGNSYMNREDYIEVKFKLGEKLKILYRNSKVIIDDEKIIDLELKKKIINDLISGIYIHFDYLNELYKQDVSENILMKKHNQ